MVKKVIFSANKEHDVISSVMEDLKQLKDAEFIFHDALTDHVDKKEFPVLFEGVNLLIVKVQNEYSIDLLNYAKHNNIPTLHDLDTVLMCKNKYTLDEALRNVFLNHSVELEKFKLPESWIQDITSSEEFKEWAKPHLPIVLKSHHHHDNEGRFNFLMREVEEVDLFHKMYGKYLSSDVYIQKFIECDGIDRKIYVIGDKVFGIKRENPIYIFLRENLNSIDVDTIKREEFKVSDNIKKLSKLISKELNLKIFGFDLLKPLKEERLYLIDLNVFPGLRGISNIQTILVDFLKKLI